MMETNTPKKIGGMKFGLLSPAKVRKMSATRIITPDTYNEDGFPIAMGLMDPHLGVIEPGLRCKTCGQQVGKDGCPGHFGHIELAMPVVHVGYVKTIRDILRVTCRSCGNLLCEESVKETLIKEYDELLERDRNVAEFTKKVILKVSNVKECPYCGRKKLDVELDKPTTFREATIR